MSVMREWSSKTRVNPERRALIPARTVRSSEKQELETANNWNAIKVGIAVITLGASITFGVLGITGTFRRSADVTVTFNTTITNQIKLKLKSVSAYKLAELQKLAEEHNVPRVVDGKKQTKQQIYNKLKEI